MIDVRAVFQQGHRALAVDRMPSVLLPRKGRFGLVDYWRATGKWPDFCAEPGQPYDCKAEAAKYSTTGG